MSIHQQNKLKIPTKNAPLLLILQKCAVLGPEYVRLSLIQSRVARYELEVYKE